MMFFNRKFHNPREKYLLLFFGNDDRGYIEINFRWPRFRFDYTSFYPQDNTYDSWEWTGRIREFHYEPGYFRMYIMSACGRHWGKL